MRGGGLERQPRHERSGVGARGWSSTANSMTCSSWLGAPRSADGPLSRRRYPRAPRPAGTCACHRQDEQGGAVTDRQRHRGRRRRAVGQVFYSEVNLASAELGLSLQASTGWRSKATSGPTPTVGGRTPSFTLGLTRSLACQRGTQTWWPSAPGTAKGETVTEYGMPWRGARWPGWPGQRYDGVL